MKQKWGITGVVLLVLTVAHAGSLTGPQFPGKDMFRCDVHVNAAMGVDRGHGTARRPYKTISFALRQVHEGNAVCVAAGTYDAALGEIFPIVIPAGVTLRAELSPQIRPHAEDGLESGLDLSEFETGQPVIAGAADYAGLANVAVVASNRSTIAGFEVRVPSLDPENVDVGVLVIAGAARIRANVFQGIGYGHVGGAGVGLVGDASPLIQNNAFVGCHDGIAAFGFAAPRIRRNLMIGNENQAVYFADHAAPDLGVPGDPGENFMKNNRTRNVYNYTVDSVVSAVGNIWDVNCTTDALGRYAPRLVMGPADNESDCPGEPSNYKIENGGAGIQF